MKPLQAILDFLLSMTSLFFRFKRKGKPGKPLVDGTGSPVCLPSEPGSGAGFHRSDTDALEAGRETTPVNLLGWAMIVGATRGYLLKLVSSL